MSGASETRRLAAILAADVAGYTKLVEYDTSGTVAAWTAARDEVVKPQVEKHRGKIVKLTGDGFLVEFPTVLDAVKHIRERRGNCFLWNNSFQQELVAHARRIHLLGDPLPQTPTRFPTGMFDGVAPRRMVKHLF